MATKRRKTHYLPITLSIILTILFSKIAIADDFQNFQDFLQQSTFNGGLRMYDFNRDYAGPKPNQSAFSLGGIFNLQTAPFWGGFGAGASFYTANPLGLNNPNSQLDDTTLPSSSINTLGQAYLQYQNHLLLVRGGDQLITTPWLNEADSRMLPATYQGVYVNLTPISGFNFTALRIIDFKSRTSNSFTATNLYNPVNIGGTPIKALGGEKDDGVLAFGASYQHTNLKAQTWFYQFYDFAQLAYGDVHYTFNINSKINPMIAAQIVSETGSGSNILNQFGLGIANATVYGALLGINIPNGQFTVAYNGMPTKHGAFNNGDLISPYTTGYVSDPLFTSSMDAGLIEKSAGDAFKVSANYFILQHQLQLAASYAKYYTQPNLPNTDETDFDATYSFKGLLKGLSIRDRIGILNGNKTSGRFVYNRLMLQYSFKV